MISIKEHLESEWHRFIIIVINIWSLAFLLFTLGLGAVLVTTQQSGSDPIIVATLTALVSLSSGILGGIWAKKWDDLTEKKVLVARGITAIRSLTLLVDNITELKKRVESYLKRHFRATDPSKITPELVKTYFEEIILRCRTFEKEGLGSIDNWNDVIPTANVNSQVDILQKNALKQSELLQQIETLQGQLQGQQETEEEVRTLKAQLSKLNLQFRQARSQQLRKDPLGVGATAITASGIPDGTIVTQFLSPKMKPLFTLPGRIPEPKEDIPN